MWRKGLYLDGGTGGTATADPVAPPAPAPSTETQNPTSQGITGTEPMIPKQRFDEVNRRLRELEAAASTAEAERKKREDAEAAKRGEFEQLATARQAEVDQLKRERQERDDAIRALQTRHAVVVEAQALNVVDADAAYRLLDLAHVEYGEDGRPRNIKPLLEQLVKDKPYLAGAASTSPRPGNTAGPRPAGTPDGDAVTRSRHALLATGRYAGL